MKCPEKFKTPVEISRDFFRQLAVLEQSACVTNCLLALCVRSHRYGLLGIGKKYLRVSLWKKA